MVLGAVVELPLGLLVYSVGLRCTVQMHRIQDTEFVRGATYLISSVFSCSLLCISTACLMPAG